jgi:hypothetical protein
MRPRRYIKSGALLEINFYSLFRVGMEEYDTSVLFAQVLQLLRISKDIAFRSLLQNGVTWERREEWRDKARKMRVYQTNKRFAEVLEKQTYTQDEESSKKETIFLINLIPDTPYVLWAGDDLGYGLFAHRDLFGGSSENPTFVTAYGGVRVTDPDANGDYLLAVNPDGRNFVAYNSLVGFKFGEKGRWINTYQYEGKRAGDLNVKAVFNYGGHAVAFFVRPGKTVKRGEQFFWDYGKEY